MKMKILKKKVGFKPSKMTDKEQLEDKIKELEREIRYLKKNDTTIQLGGFGGITIPLDEEIKTGISKYIAAEVRRVVAEDKELPKNIIYTFLKHNEFAKNLLRPLVRDVIQDLHVTVKFRVDDEWDQDH